MPKLVKLETNEIVSDDWTFLEADAPLPENLEGYLLPLSSFLENSENLDGVGIWLASADDAFLLAGKLDKVTVLVCKFEAFADGRSFSQARIVRDHLEFSGTIRASGYFIQDQLHYLARCGFNEFSVADDADEDSIRESLADFSESYQAACDVPAPLFRRRA